MNIEKLRKQLEIDEGVELKIYLDSKNLATCGIGHLIIKGDEEWNKPIGTPITRSRVEALFVKDIQSVINDCKKLFTNFEELEEEIKQIIANMMFNMGLTRLSKFVKLIAAIKAKNFKEAANQMANSNWAKQVGARATRLITRMENLSI